MEDRYHTYKCPKNCHIRIYPMWAGDEADKCPKCETTMIYKGYMTEESINQMQRDSKQHLIDKIRKSKKNLPKKRKRK